MIVFSSLHLHRRLSVGSWLVIMPNTTRSMDQHPEGEWMLHILRQESGINHHR
nr:MAG TPA: hypothetical protein [Caudoviricetes sp.]